ncbi:MAG: hypothetical protein K8W52_29575 [Deltaproteobacteria bacterium]|nr:hypothetical protein [Deltaproteobacteria bacterium]
MRLVSSALITAVLATLTGCPDRELAKLDPSADKAETKEIPVTLNDNVDILFVVDNSGSMKEEQTSLAANFPRFIQKLATLPNGLPSVHIGVVSTDVGTGNNDICNGVGDDGQLQTNGCGGISGAYLSDVATAGGGRDRNYSGDLAQQFACTAQLGTSGCGAEQPLESMRLALDPTRNKNPGFIRDNAYLAVVIISDEDDCSTRDRAMFGLQSSTTSSLFSCTAYGLSCDEADLTGAGAKHGCIPNEESQYMYGVDEYADFLIGLKGEKNVIVAGITGDPDPVTVVHDDNGDPVLSPSCESQFGKATPAVRNRAFLDHFSQRTAVRICDSDLSAALDKIAVGILGAIGDPCIQGTLADRNPSVDGVQPECSVTDVIHPDTATEEQHSVAACNAAVSNTPCWRLVTDADQCGDWPSKLKLVVERGSTTVPSDTHVRAQCVTR